MFDKKSIENKIRIKAILLYAFLAFACVATAFSVWEIRKDMQLQKQYVADHNRILTLTSDILTGVEEAQRIANTRAVGRKRVEFEQHLEQITLLMDSLNLIETQHFDEDMGSEVIALLQEKAVIIRRLHAIFNRTNPIDPIREKLQEVRPVLEKDTVLITTVIQDTTIRQAPKRKFWRRFADLFSAPVSTDTIIQSITLQADTVMASQEETKAILTDVSYFAEDASLNYERRMQDIAGQITSLLKADQSISNRLSELLMKLFHTTIRSATTEIEKAEKRIDEYYHYLTVGAVGSLILILIFILLILHDVNQGREVRRALQQSNDRVNQLLESRHKMLLSVSHDIKSPLNSILGFLELWKSGSDKTAHDLNSMCGSGNHILSLLENLLEFSALEQGKLSLCNQPVLLRNLFDETAIMFEPLCRKKSLRLNLTTDLPDDFCVNTDPLKLKQLLINLLSNAVKYTSVGEVSLSVSIRAGFLRIEVSDTGAGIPAEKVDSLFLPFERVSENNRLAEGAGLGLFVVKGLVELFRGEVHVDSQVGRGTTFLLLLPYMTVSRQEEKTEFQQILVVDDDPVLLKLTRKMLEKLGHKAETCATAEEFAHRFNGGDHAFDAVLTDMEMNTFSGRELLKRVRKHSQEIPVFIMTGRSDYHVDIATLQGFDGYLPKPFTLDSLKGMFGGITVPNYELNQLTEMFDGDESAVCEVIGLFCRETTANAALLAEAMKEDDFDRAQSLCHKMLPMFAQLQADDIVGLLRKIDLRKGDPYPEWKKDVLHVTEIIDPLVKHLSDNYKVGDQSSIPS